MEKKRCYGKIARRWRRILSSMLVLAMILSSVPTTGAVYAAELPVENLIESAETASTEAASIEAEPAESTEADSEETRGGRSI